DAIASYGRDARYQRFAIADPAMNGRGRADVLHEAANIRRQSTTRDFCIRYQLNELVLAARRVDRRHQLQHDSFVVQLGQGRLYPDDGFGYVDFDGADAHSAPLCTT